MPQADIPEMIMSLPEVVTGGSDHFIKHWNGMGQLNMVMGAHDAGVNVVALLFASGKDGKPLSLLLSGGDMGLLKMWDASSDEMANALPLRSVKAHDGALTALAVSSNGLLIATGGADTYIRLWYRPTGQMLCEVKAHDDAVRSLQFTRDGGTLVSAGADHLIRAWRVGAGGQDLDCLTTIVAHEDTINALSLAPDGRTVASVSQDGYLKLWQVKDGILLRRIRVCPRGVLTTAFAHDGATIATGDQDGKIRIWNARTGMPTPFIGVQERGVYALAWTREGDMLVSGGDKSLYYWNVALNRQTARIAAHDGIVQALAIVPSER